MAVCQTKTFMKPNGNALQIDTRLTNYDYDVSIENIDTFMFNTDLQCSYVSSFVRSHRGSRQSRSSDAHSALTLTVLFPADLVEFFRSFLKSALKKPQTIHVVINDHHILYSSHTYTSHMDDIIGIIMHEIPFTNVQQLVPNRRADVMLIQVHYIVSADGEIFAMETVNWNKLLVNFIENNTHLIEDKQVYQQNLNSDAILHKNIFDIIHSSKIQNVYRTLFNHVMTNNAAPLRFCWYCNTNTTIMKTLTTVSKLLDSKPFAMITSEVTEKCAQTDEQPAFEYLSYPHFFPYVPKPPEESNALTVCYFCQRILCADLSKVEEDQARRNTINSAIVRPLFDDQLNVPVVGQRGRNGHQSLRIIDNATKSVNHCWMTNKEWCTNKNRCNMKIPYVIHDICELCVDEWMSIYDIYNITQAQ